MEWNQTNPRDRILILPTQIAQRVQAMRLTRQQRFIKTAPPELRGAVLRELER